DGGRSRGNAADCRGTPPRHPDPEAKDLPPKRRGFVRGRL
ncbi:MAG: hypothetical protein AVDCRST_MAG59-610, partial [uncultured Thermomicrobiales bacterium]